MDNIVSNAQKGFSKIKGLFSKSSKSTQKKNISPPKKKEENETNKMTIKESSSDVQLNFDLEDDDHPTTPSPKSSPSKTQVISEYKEVIEDEWLISHRVFPKRMIVDIEQMPYVPFINKKQIENVITMLGFGNSKNKNKEIKYVALFDEHFVYMINMSLKENNQNNFNKKIGNHYDLQLISNIDIRDDIEKGRKIITLLFILDNNIETYKSITKEFYFDFNNAVKFFNILKFYLGRLGIPLNYQNEEFAKMNGINVNDPTKMRSSPN